MDINEKLDQKAKELDKKKQKGKPQDKPKENPTKPKTIADSIPEEVTIGDQTYKKEEVITGDAGKDGLVANMLKKQQEAKDIAKKLAEKSKDVNNEISPMISGLKTDGDGNTSIDQLLEEVEDNRKKEEVGLGEDDDIQTMLDKIESEKVYADVVPNDEKTGPSDYIVNINPEYVEAVEGILDLNHIRIVKKSATEKNAVLDRFSNSGTNVNMVMVNSGIFIKSSGFGPGEIIAMNNIKTDKPALVELTRLNHVCEHITGSTIGRMKVNRLIKVVSYYDKDSLFYAAYAGTYPRDSEINRTCEKCGAEFYTKIATPDLLLNADEFGPRADYIRNNVTTLEELINVSELGKVKIKKHSSGIVVHYKHPSLETYITTLQRLDPKIISRYSHLVEYVYGIDKILIADENGNSVPYTDPNEIILTLSKLKDAEEKYEVLDMINETKPSVTPVYGFKEIKCPHCGHMNAQQAIPMEQLLFFQASRQEEMAALKWSAKEQKKKKLKKKD